MSPAVPTSMKAVVLESFRIPEALAVRDLEVPALRSGEVLVKMGAAPINPSDLVFLRDQYGVKKRLPVVPGFEGAGTVIAARGVLAGTLLGRKVACWAPEEGNGTWAEYMVCRASACLPLLTTISAEEGASLIVNPLTAWALMGIVKHGGHRAFIQTGAASALGKMLGRLARREGVEVLHIVRRREQVELLKSLGCTYVLDNSQEGFEAQLKMLTERFKIRLALDAVGGKMTAVIARCMLAGSQVIVYGALSGDDCCISPTSLVFENKSLAGFWLTEWVKRRTIGQKLWMAYQVQRLLKKELKTDVQARFPLDQIHEAIDLYKKKRTDGKVLLIP
jgi:NADPH2:quinone reductase